MKKIIIASMLLIAGIAQSFAGPIITVSVEFGRKPDCTGRGICRVTVGGSWKNTLQIDNNTGNLLMVVQKSSLTAANLDQFANGVFEVGADYLLPAELCEKLETESFTIRRGNYTVTETSGQYTVLFTKSSTSIR
jgi:hypothetical protein